MVVSVESEDRIWVSIRSGFGCCPECINDVEEYPGEYYEDPQVYCPEYEEEKYEEEQTESANDDINFLD